MFLSINMSILEFDELADKYYNILALHKADLVDVKEYLLAHMDPEELCDDKFFREINEKMYMQDTTKMMNGYLESIKHYPKHTIISVPSHNLNGIKKFVENDMADYFMSFVNKMVSYVNMEYTWIQKLKYEQITIHQLCNDFGKNVFWRSN